jgi:hypothetical protein
MRILIPLLFTLTLHFEIYSQDQSLLLSKHFEAHNVDFWRQVNTFTSKGTWESLRQNHSIDFIATRKCQMKIISAAKDVVYAFDGSNGWKLEEKDGKIIDFDQNEIEIFRLLFDFGTPVYGKNDLKEMGEVTVDGVLCEWLIFRNKISKTDYFIRKSDFTLYKINHQYDTGGDNRIISKKIVQYRDYQGIKIPTIIEIKTREEVFELALRDMTIGEAVNQGIFKKPEQK